MRYDMGEVLLVIFDNLLMLTLLNRKMYVFILTITLMFLNTACVADSRNQAEIFVNTISYVNIYHPDNYLVFQGKNEVIAGGDVVDEGTLCNLGIHHACFRSKPFTFTVPDGNKDIVLDGIKFHLSAIKHVATSNGEEYQIYIIVGFHDKGKNIYWYSSINGLLGFTVTIDGHQATYILLSECGFGSISTCKNNRGQE